MSIILLCLVLGVLLVAILVVVILLVKVVRLRGQVADFPQREAALRADAWKRVKDGAPGLDQRAARAVFCLGSGTTSAVVEAVSVSALI
jgi:hypothetical protein